MSETRGNIIAILAYDMEFSDTSPYDGALHAPRLQQPAACALPSFTIRPSAALPGASLLSDLYPHQAAVGHMGEDNGLPGYLGELDEHAIPIAQALGTAGYSTYMSGKWHVIGPLGYWSGDSSKTSKRNWLLQRSFDAFYGKNTLTEDNTPVAPAADDYYFIDAITERAADYAVRAIKAGFAMRCRLRGCYPVGSGACMEVGRA